MSEESNELRKPCNRHLFSLVVNPITLPQAIYIDSVVIPELYEVLLKHFDNLKELGKEL